MVDFEWVPVEKEYPPKIPVKVLITVERRLYSESFPVRSVKEAIWNSLPTGKEFPDHEEWGFHGQFYDPAHESKVIAWAYLPTAYLKDF